jgi:hypothetical protein
MSSHVLLPFSRLAERFSVSRIPFSIRDEPSRQVFGRSWRWLKAFWVRGQGSALTIPISHSTWEIGAGLQGLYFS